MIDMQLTMTIPELSNIEAKFKRYPIRAAKALDAGIRKSALLIVSNSKKELGRKGNAGVDTGRMRSSISAEFAPLRAVISPKVNYAIFVHQGTKPHFPPISAIAPWARRHGINPYVLAKSIAKKGTKANPFMARALETSVDGVRSIFREEMKKGLKE